MSYIADVVFITSHFGDASKADTARFQQLYRDYMLERYGVEAAELEPLASAGPKWPSITVFHVTFNHGPVQELVDASQWKSEDTVLYVDAEDVYYHHIVRGGQG